MQYKNTDFIFKISQSIQLIMDKKNIEVSDLADRLGVDERQIRRIVKGETNFSISEVERFAVGLGVQPKELLNFDIKLNQEFIPPISKEENS